MRLERIKIVSSHSVEIFLRQVDLGENRSKQSDNRNTHTFLLIDWLRVRSLNHEGMAIAFFTVAFFNSVSTYTYHHRYKHRVMRYAHRPFFVFHRRPAFLLPLPDEHALQWCLLHACGGAWGLSGVHPVYNHYGE